MPKKKKGSGKKGKKGKAKGKGKDSKPAAPAGPTELEIALRLELEQLEKEVALSKREAEEAKGVNAWLREEVQRTEAETQDYEAFMSKKTGQEQSKLLHLTDQNQRRVEAVAAERRQRAAAYNEAKAGLQDVVLQREAEIQRIQTQVDELAEFAALRRDQNDEIARLEKAIEDLNTEHFDKLQALKSEHLDEKIQFQKAAHQSVSQLEGQAQEEATRCLEKHSQKIKRENKRLRKTLLDLINQNKSLQERERVLTVQNKELLRQDELNLHVMDQSSLKQARSTMRRLSLGGQGSSQRRASNMSSRPL